MFQVIDLENTFWEPVSMTAEEGITVVLSDDKEALTQLSGFLSGYRVPKKGKVLVGELEADGTRVGYMPVQSPVYEDMTVLQWLAFMAELKGMSALEAQQQAMDLVETYAETELGDVMLSKKMDLLKRKQAVLLQTLTGTPSILVLDQPAGDLEGEDVQQIYDMIQKIAQEYPVILLLTDPITAEMLGKTLYLFYDGVMEAVTVEELHEKYAQIYQELVKEQRREEDDLTQILEDYEGGVRNEEPDDAK